MSACGSLSGLWLTGVLVAETESFQTACRGLGLGMGEGSHNNTQDYID